MTERQLVKDTLELGSPERIPRDIWILPWAFQHQKAFVERLQAKYPSDFARAPGFHQQLAPVQGDAYTPGTYIDEWGCIFVNKQQGIIGEVKTSCLPDLSRVDELVVPTANLTIDSSQINQFCAAQSRFVLADCCPRPFERLQFIRGTEQLYMDLMEQRPELLQLVRTVHAFYMEELERWAQTDVDGLMFMDDWGSQQALLINPVLWRQLFRPLYKEYIDLAHSYGKYIFMHSDGYILDIVPDLIDLGLDALNSQLFCMGVDNLRPFRGQLTFWGEIDRQHLLPYGSKEDVVQGVHDVYHALYWQGGIIGQCEFGPGSRPENVWAVFETWDSI